MAISNEELLHAIKGVGAQVGNLQNRFDQLDGRVGNLEEQTKTNCGKLDKLQASVDRIERRIEGNKVSLNPE